MTFLRIRERRIYYFMLAMAVQLCERAVKRAINVSNFLVNNILFFLHSCSQCSSLLSAATIYEVLIINKSNIYDDGSLYYKSKPLPPRYDKRSY